MNVQMKIGYYILISTILSILSFFSLQAQNTEGTDFWLTFGQNSAGTSSSTANLQIRFVAKDHQASARIYFTNLGTFKDFDIPARQVLTYSLDNTEKQAVYNTTEGVSNYSIHITSNAPVTVYAMNQKGASTDATNILPATAIGTEYYHISYDTWFDRYGIIATEDNTEVFINTTSIGILNVGNVYYKIATNNEDMTGDYITSNKPIAFFSLMRSFAINPISGSDHGMQQLAPVKTWGKNFFVPVSHLVQDIVRIVASQNGTDILQTGGTIRTVPGGQMSLINLQAGQFVELAVPLSNNGCDIHTNYPVGICNYLWGGSAYGDAAICWLPPIEQMVNSALVAPFFPSGPTEIHSHYATLFTPTLTRDNTKVSIGGASPTGLIGVTWLENIASGMSFCKIQLTNDTAAYYFTNPAGFLIFCFGIGNSESYYYLAYSAMRDLDAAFYANDIHFQDLKDNSMCEGTVEFRTEIEGLHQTHEERIRWFVNGTEESGTLNQETWQKNFIAGNYDIRMWVRYANNDTISKTGTLKIKTCNQSAAFFANNVLHSELTDTTFCNKNMNFRAEIEGLHPTASDSIMWYINDVFETSQATWNKTFENGTYEIKLVVHYNNDTYATLTGTLKIQALWIKIKNVRY